MIVLYIPFKAEEKNAKLLAIANNWSNMFKENTFLVLSDDSNVDLISAPPQKIKMYILAYGWILQPVCILLLSTVTPSI